jgi:hypothetical protein
VLEGADGEDEKNGRRAHRVASRSDARERYRDSVRLN